MINLKRNLRKTFENQMNHLGLFDPKGKKIKTINKLKTNEKAIEKVYAPCM